MCLNSEQLEEVKKLAGLFYNPEEIAEVMELDIQEFKNLVSDKSTKESKAFTSGYKTSEVAFRQKLIATAMIGSSPAQTQVQKLIDKLNNNLMER